MVNFTKTVTYGPKDNRTDPLTPSRNQLRTYPWGIATQGLVNNISGFKRAKNCGNPLLLVTWLSARSLVYAHVWHYSMCGFRNTHLRVLVHSCILSMCPCSDKHPRQHAFPLTYPQRTPIYICTCIRSWATFVRTYLRTYVRTYIAG